MKNRKNKLFVQIFVFIFTMLISNAYSQEARIPCFKEDGGIGLKGLDKFDCGLIKSVVNDPKIKSSYEDKVLNKLAKQIANKATQRLEEIALLDQYFSQNSKDLSMNSNEVKKECRLDVISTPKCGNNTNPTNYKKKLAMLLSNFPSDSKNATLYDRMRGKFSEMRGIQVNNNQCPLSGTSGAFFILSQLTESDANNLVDSLKSSRAEEINKYYDRYPQLKMLRNAARNGKDGQKLVEDFEKHLKSFDKNHGSAKNYINNFLFNDSNQQQMAKSLATQCGSIANNIKDYLCEDLSHLGMPEKFANDYFNDEDSETDGEIAKGFSCGLKKVVNGSPVEDEKVLTTGNTIFSWNKKFNDDVRDTGDETVAKRNVAQFCNMYLCKADISKGLKSCANGGPVSSSDMLEKYCKDSSGDLCKKDYLNWISYLASLEKDKKEIYEPNQSLANGSAPDSPGAKPKSYSSFYQNFLGVEGTLLAEGKKLTPIAIEEKKAEFAEKRLEPASQTLALNQGGREAIRGDSRSEMMSQPSMREDLVASSNNPTRDNGEEFRKTFANQYAKIPSDTPLASAKSKKSGFTDVDDQRLDEMKKLRSELVDAINKVKGTDEEKLAAVADNNAAAIAPKNSLKDTTKNLSQAEKDRLDSYRDNLTSWESRLRNWQGQLNDRDVRTNSGPSSSAASDSRGNNYAANAAAAANDQASSSNSSANNIKLTKTGAAGTGTVSGKADGATERAPGAEKAEGEQDIVNSENLATLQKDSLKKLGIVASDSFIIKVRHMDKIYAIPVKTFSHDGKSMYVPLLNDKNRELSRIVYESPLFKDYRDYQLERQYKLEKK